MNWNWSYRPQTLKSDPNRRFFFHVRHFLLTFFNVTFFFGFSFSGLFPLYVSWCGFFSIIFSFGFSVFLLVVPYFLSGLLMVSQCPCLFLQISWVSLDHFTKSFCDHFSRHLYSDGLLKWNSLGQLLCLKKNDNTSKEKYGHQQNVMCQVIGKFSDWDNINQHPSMICYTEMWIAQLSITVFTHWNLPLYLSEIDQFHKYHSALDKYIPCTIL